MFKQSRYGLMWGVLSLVFLSGCSTFTKSSTVRFEVTGASVHNVGAKGQALPVVIQAYVLSRPESFISYGIRSFEQGKPPQSNSILAWRECVLTPGGKCRLTLKSKKQANWASVVVLFRNPKGKVWKMIKPLKNSIQLFSERVVVRVGAQGIQTE